MKRAAEFLRKDYVQTAIMVVIVMAGAVAFWYGLRFAFRTEHPLLAVASGSMEPVLYKGDLILVQGVHDVCEIHAAPKYENQPGDIIVFHKPGDPRRELIVHRAIEKINGTDGYYLITKGDANPGEDRWKVKDADLVGVYTGAKVPLLGHIALFFEPST